MKLHLIRCDAYGWTVWDAEPLLTPSKKCLLYIVVQNKPGALGELAGKLAAKNINNDHKSLKEGQCDSRGL